MEKIIEKIVTFHQTPANTGARLDKFLSDDRDVGLSRARIQKLIENGSVTVNNERKKASYQLTPGDTIKIAYPLSSVLLEASEDVEFDLLYEDSSIAVVNKPPGLVVHPSAGHEKKTLVHGLLYRCNRLSSGDPIRPGVVHRLDKDTSGVMVIAKNNEAHDHLARQFKKREIKKRYLALVHGAVEKEKGIIDLPISRHPVRRKEMSISLSKGREAKSEWEVISVFPLGFSFLKIALHTGRTHQIRVHMAYMGYPIMGDAVYGYGKRWWKKQSLALKEAFALVKRQMLHAEILGFLHPDSLKYVEFKAPIPKDMALLIKWLDEYQNHKF